MKNSTGIEKLVYTIFGVTIFMFVAYLFVLMFAVFSVGKEVDQNGGVAKTIGTFVREFECAKNNNCESND